MQQVSGILPCMSPPNRNFPCIRKNLYYFIFIGSYCIIAIILPYFLQGFTSKERRQLLLQGLNLHSKRKYLKIQHANICKEQQLVVKTQIAYLALGQNFDSSMGKGVKNICEFYVNLRAITKDIKKVAQARGKYGFAVL